VSAPSSRLFARKSIAQIQRDASSQGLARVLGPWQLLLLGVGCILGAGIYVTTGYAAANFAGPAVLLAFVLAGSACGLTALCYAELASALPLAGSSYSYAYVSIGEVVAFSIGWLILFEYGIAAALLAVGFSGYFMSLLRDFGIVIPPELTTPMVRSIPGPHGMTFVMSRSANALAGLTMVLITFLLAVGVRKSALVNNLMVALKLLVLVIFIVVGVQAIDLDNWTPFIPPNEGGFAYGWEGILRATSLLFFAYVGFETVSSAAAESRNPQKDMAFGILGALFACMLFYIVVSSVLTGIVPYRELGVPDPIALASDYMGHPGIATVIKVGACAGLFSVLLGSNYGQSRLSYAMACDGLLPRMFARIHKRWQTPLSATVVLGTIATVLATLLPITILGDLVTVGTPFAFAIICICLMWLRTKQPDLPRPFRVPLGGIWMRGVWIGFVPTLAAILCVTCALPGVLDIIAQAGRGDVIPACILGAYVIAGAVFYVTYRFRRAH